jgi:hypothetical protein
MTMVRRGRIPTVPEVAVKARVSRATAYRAFPSRSKLVNAVVAEGLAPVRRFEPRAADEFGRVRELFDKTFPLFKRYEPHMRAALQPALEHQSLERMGILEEEPYRRGHRRYMLHRAAAPLTATLGPEAYERLLKALSLIYGIESYVVLRDIWGASYREVEAVRASCWKRSSSPRSARRRGCEEASRAPRGAPPRRGLATSSATAGAHRRRARAGRAQPRGWRPGAEGRARRGARPRTG